MKKIHYLKRPASKETLAVYPKLVNVGLCGRMCSRQKSTIMLTEVTCEDCKRLMDRPLFAR